MTAVNLRRVLPLPLCALVLTAAAACSSDEKSPPAAAPAAGPRVSVLVTNDDGVKAAGIDALVRRLQSVPNLDISVVAPAENQSGSGGKTTPGTLARQPSATASGYPATAVTGYPADTVRVALDDLGLRPALVLSGVNAGQNTGPLVRISGTVGAARAAATRGIPAIAASSGIPADEESYDFDVAANLAAGEVEKLLPKLGTAEASTTTVQNLNVPSCEEGAVRGLRMFPPATQADGAPILEPSDCTSTAEPTDEISAFHDGFAVLTTVPAQAQASG